ncbi:MAG: hypothetical protein ACRCVA_06520 [Phreatobacter sp.]
MLGLGQEGLVFGLPILAGFIAAFLDSFGATRHLPNLPFALGIWSILVVSADVSGVFGTELGAIVLVFGLFGIPVLLLAYGAARAAFGSLALLCRSET